MALLVVAGDKNGLPLWNFIYLFSVISKISMKGPWTHFPSGESLLDISKSLQILKSLTRKAR